MHRAGHLHQSNKPFKSRHTTKSAIKARNGGKVSSLKAHRPSFPSKNAPSKADRRNAAKIEQQKRRRQIIDRKRLFSNVPVLTMVVPLCPDIDVDVVLKQLSFISDGKQRVDFVSAKRDGANTYQHVLDVLDLSQCADYVLFVLSAEEEVDALGETVLAMLRAQGMPPAISLVQHLEKESGKQKENVRKSLAAYMQDQLAEQTVRVYDVSSESDTSLLERILTEASKRYNRSQSWRDWRSYLLAQDIQYDSQSGRVAVSGYSRGAPFNVTRPIHLPSIGDVPVSEIRVHDHRTNEIVAILKNKNRNSDELVHECEPDLMANEQTWPTEEEIREAEERIKKIKVPEGTSTYQASWLDDEEGDAEVDNHPEFDDNDELLSDASSLDGDSMVPVSTQGNMTVEMDMTPDQEEEAVRAYLEQRERRLAQEEALDFPDEVDTPVDVPARERFQKYRGLESMRSANWDPYENLPLDYGRIFQFENFDQMKNVVKKMVDSEISEAQGDLKKSSAMDEDKDITLAPVGRRITIVLDNITKEVFETISARPLVIFGLLPHEHQMSVMNFTCTRHMLPGAEAANEAVVQSKDMVLISCGFRRFFCRPLYSQHSRGSLHKYEKFFPVGRNLVGTVFAPITFPPAPILMIQPFLKSQDGSAPLPKLVATGNLLSMAPTRMLIKRIVLTGHIHKAHSTHLHTVRHMFFNAADVHYFKPVPLTTKHGRKGLIKDSIGSHGAMKCHFDRVVQGNDTVLMNLYKRVYPKWPENGYQSLFGMDRVQREKDYVASLYSACVDNDEESDDENMLDLA